MSIIRSPKDETSPMIINNSPKPILKTMYSLLLSNWLVSACRISLIIMIYVFKDIFLAKNPWDYLIFTMIGLIDAISLLGEINTYKVLKQEQRVLESIQSQRQQQIVPTSRTRFGNYQSYLSIYETLFNYKYKYNATSSSYSIIRYLHFISSFGIFGSLALKNIRIQDSQIQDHHNLIKELVLSIVLLSVYISSFQVDYAILQNSRGKYQNMQKITNGVSKQIINKFCFWRKGIIVMYIITLASVVTSVGLLITRQILMNFLWVMINCSVMGAFLITSIVIQLKNINQVIVNPHILNKPLYSQNICNIYQLLHQLKSKAPQFHICVATGTRVAGFCVYIILMIYCVDMQAETVGVIASIPFCLILSEMFKFFYAHRCQINYLEPVTLSLQQRVHQNCSICLSNYVDNNQACELPCSAQHMYHYDCIKDWVRNKKQCPLCRFDLSQFLK